FILKLVEMSTRRDALVLIFLGFFAVVTSYLFEDSLLAGLYSLLPVTALLAAMIGLQQSSLVTRPWPTVRLAGALLLQAVPLMLVLFLFFPRLPPLWSLPQAGDRGTTGLADHMAPGDIARLGRSAELAFRVSFDGEIPPRDQLYWRAVTFERFDGRRWSQSYASNVPQAPEWQALGEPLSYSVVMQPSGQPWLFALDVAQVASGGAQLMTDFHLQRRQPVTKPLMYQVTSWLDARREAIGAPESLARALQLPEQGNPRSRTWAAELRRSAQEPQAVVDALLRHFNREPYHYTLEPPPVGSDIVDDFLFQTRSGFCAHYAGAMTFVLRAAGIPARVVAGYQGGEVNPAGNYLSVHQFDAHAWVEYWVAERGWVSVDPTFQVAPERVEQGLEQALARERSFLADEPLSLLRFRDVGWMNTLRLRWDSLNYGWQRWVLNYQDEQQSQMLQRWFGKLDGQALGLGLVAVLGLLTGILALVLFKPWRREKDVQQRQFDRFERLLARQGIRRHKGEGARSFAERAAIEMPDQAPAIRAFVRLYEAQRYAQLPGPGEELSRALTNVRRAMPWRIAAPRRHS
ncbi:transglutaminase TgpA family protein, partial [Stutzerimonas stutzeri]